MKEFLRNISQKKFLRKYFSEIFNEILSGIFHKYVNLNIKFHNNILNYLI